MSRHCCADDAPAERPARRFYHAAAALLPGAGLLFLPKCPLCLAAWLAAATGLGIPLAAVAHLRTLLVIWIAAVGVTQAAALHRLPCLRRN
jgi:hypothetical protein